MKQSGGEGRPTWIREYESENEWESGQSEDESFGDSSSLSSVSEEADLREDFLAGIRDHEIDLTNIREWLTLVGTDLDFTAMGGASEDSRPSSPLVTAIEFENYPLVVIFLLLGADPNYLPEGDATYGPLLASFAQKLPVYENLKWSETSSKILELVLRASSVGDNGANIGQLLEELNLTADAGPYETSYYNDYLRPGIQILIRDGHLSPDFENYLVDESDLQSSHAESRL